MSHRCRGPRALCSVTACRSDALSAVQQLAGAALECMPPVENEPGDALACGFGSLRLGNSDSLFGRGLRVRQQM